MSCPTCQQQHETDRPCATTTDLWTPDLASGPNAAPFAADDLVGKQLGSFRVLQKIGSGGMGSVYLAEHVVIGSHVAVKVLHPSLSSDPVILQRFHSEARAVNLIGHENILKIYDLCSENGL